MRWRLAGGGAERLLLPLLLASALGLRIEAPAGGEHEAAAAEELPDDALRVLPLPPDDRRPSLAAIAKGQSVAESWRQCRAWAKTVPHRSDVIASARGGFLYVANAKAGSTSLTDILGKVLHKGWIDTDVPHDAVSDANKGCGDRVTSRSFSAKTLASLFRFSIVRDPVAKFESGVRQVWHADGRYKEYSADAMLDLQLSFAEGLSEPGQFCTGNWLNTHLQPSSWRLSTTDSEGNLLDYSFLAKIEAIDEDWPAIVASLTNISEEQRVGLMAIGHANPHEHDARSKLSPEGIRRMCNSSVYGSDWECFGYPRPAVCG